MERTDRAVAIDYGSLGEYSCLLVLTLAVLIARDFRNFLAYIYIGIFCILNLTAAAIGIAKRSNIVFHAITAIATIDSASIAALLLAFASSTSEIHLYFARARKTALHGKTEKRIIRLFLYLVHILCILGLTLLVIAGGFTVGLDSPPANKHWTRTLSKAGAGIFFLTWILQYIYIVLLWWFIFFRAFTSLSNAIRGLHLRWAVSCLLAAGLFAALRTGGVLAYYIKNGGDKDTFSPVMGKFAFRLGLFSVPSALAVGALLVAAWMTRNTGKAVGYGAVRTEEGQQARGAEGSPPYGEVPLMPNERLGLGHGQGQGQGLPEWYSRA